MNLLDDYKNYLNNIKDDYERIGKLLTYEEVVLDAKLCQKLEREKKEIQSIALKYDEFLKNEQDIAEFKSLETANTISASELDDIRLEIEKLTTKNKILTQELISLMQLKDATMSNIIILIQNNSNGDNQLQNDIRMGYREFCTKHGLIFSETCNKNTIELNIQGINANTYFKQEIGIHVNSATGNSCTVFVLDDKEKEKISFNNDDIKIQTCRSRGAGGQHINTTDSAIKATHLPSGISTTCQTERSQFQNKEIALEKLKEKVYNFYQSKYDKFINEQRTKQYKSLNLKDATKTYSYENHTIVSKSKTISFDDFLSGVEL